jgi:hypothetical protein
VGKADRGKNEAAMDMKGEIVKIRIPQKFPLLFFQPFQNVLQ